MKKRRQNRGKIKVLLIALVAVLALVPVGIYLPGILFPTHTKPLRPNQGMGTGQVNQTPEGGSDGSELAPPNPPGLGTPSPLSLGADGSMKPKEQTLGAQPSEVVPGSTELASGPTATPAEAIAGSNEPKSDVTPMPRMWTRASDGSQVEALYQSFDGTNVTILAKEKSRTMPITIFSAEDLEYVQQMKKLLNR